MFVKISCGLMAAILLVLSGILWTVFTSTHVNIQWTGSMSLGNDKVLMQASANIPGTALAAPDTSNGIALDETPKPSHKPPVRK